MTDTTDLIHRLSDEADLCRNDGATDVAKLLDDAVYALVNQAARLAAAEIVSAQPAAPAEPKGADGLPVSAPRLYADEEPPGHADHVSKARDLFDAAPSVAPEPDDGTVLDEVGDRIDKLLLLATEAIQRSGPPRDCADDYLIPAAEWLALQSEVMHRLREHAAALWAPGISAEGEKP